MLGLKRTRVDHSGDDDASLDGGTTSFEALMNVADNYGQRVRDYPTAPATDSYTFWVAVHHHLVLNPAPAFAS